MGRLSRTAERSPAAAQFRLSADDLIAATEARAETCEAGLRAASGAVPRTCLGFLRRLTSACRRRRPTRQRSRALARQKPGSSVQESFVKRGGWENQQGRVNMLRIGRRVNLGRLWHSGGACCSCGTPPSTPSLASVSGVYSLTLTRCGVRKESSPESLMVFACGSDNWTLSQVGSDVSGPHRWSMSAI